MLGFGTLRRVTRELRLDIAAAHERDPAARGVSSLEILIAWPGVQAVLAHRVVHARPAHAAIASAVRRKPLDRLHRWQASTMFSSTGWPPRTSGTTWSSSSPRKRTHEGVIQQISPTLPQ